MCSGVTTWSFASFADYISTPIMFWDWWHLLQRGSSPGIAWVFMEEVGRVWVVKLNGLLQIILLNFSLSWALNLLSPFFKNGFVILLIIFLLTFCWEEFKNTPVQRIQNNSGRLIAHLSLSGIQQESNLEIMAFSKPIKETLKNSPAVPRHKKDCFMWFGCLQ